MKIAQPEYFLLFWIVPALIAFYVWAFRRRDILLTRFASHRMLAQLIPPLGRGRQRLRAALLSSAVVMSLFALVRPQWGFHWEEITREGVDIIVAVDVSQSMMATDVTPNRLERARRELQDLLARLEGDRIGLIAFAGTAFVQCPLTLDYGAFRMFLDYLTPSLIPVPGTSIADAIRLAKQSFIDQSSRSRALILITDGEDHEGNPIDAAKDAAEAKIKIFAIGIGAEEGAPIPSPDGSGFIKDDKGQLVMTRLDEQTLKRIALETGGAYVRSTTGDMDLDRIYTEGIKASLKATELRSSRQKRWEERFQWPLGAALVLIVLELVADTRGRSAAALFIVLALMAPRGAQAGVLDAYLGRTPLRKGVAAYERGDYETALQLLTDASIDAADDPLIDYNLGNTWYRTGDYEKAEAAFTRVAGGAAPDDLREKAWYNLGNTQYRMGKLDEAVKSYEQALLLDADDDAAKRNLERTRAEIQRRLDEMKKREEKQQRENDKQQGNPSPETESGESDQQSRDGTSNAPDRPDESANQEELGDQGDKQGDSPDAPPTPRPEGAAGQPSDDAQEETSPTPEPAGQARQGGSGRNDQEQGEAGRQGEEKAGAAESPDQEPIPQGRLSRQEAQRLLDQVQDAQQSGLRAQGKRTRGGTRRVPGGRPW